MSTAARLRIHQRRKRVLSAFRPTTPFVEFVDDLAPLIAVRACNRVGKTWHGTYKVSRLAVQRPMSRLRWVGPSRAQVRDVASRYLWEFLRPYCAEGSSYKPGTGFTRNNTIVLRNGSVIQLKSYQDDPDTHAGDEFDLVALDEVPKVPHYRENLARVGTRGGQLMVLLTAINRPVEWFQEEVEGEDESPSGVDGWTRCRHTTGWTQYVIPLRYEYVEAFWPRDAFDLHVRAHQGGNEEPQRLHAAWSGAVHGRRLANFGRHCLVTAADIKGVEFDELRIGIDHGTGLGKEVAYLIGVQRHVSYLPTFWLLAEYSGEGGTTPVQDARGILAMLSRMGWELGDVDKIFGDIGMGGRHHEGRAQGGSWNEFIEHGFCTLLGYHQSPKHIEVPYKRRRAGPAGEAAMDHACKEHRWKVNRECRRFIESAMSYTGTEEDLKDPIDAARYGIQDILLGPRGERVQDWLLG